MTAVSSPLPANIGKGQAETIVYVGVDDITATLAKVKDEVPGRVVLAVFKDPAGNSVGLVELENGKPKVPPAAVSNPVPTSGRLAATWPS